MLLRYAWWGPDDWFVIDQQPRGFSRLVDTLTEESVPPGDARVVMGAEVVRVEYGECEGGGVEVATRDGRRFRAAKEVISTLPLGVMRRSHAALFSPPLPEAQATLYSEKSRFVMGNLTHVVVQFPVRAPAPSMAFHDPSVDLSWPFMGLPLTFP